MAKEYEVEVTIREKGKTDGGKKFTLTQARTSKGGLPVFVGTGDKDAPIKPYGGLYIDPKALNGKTKKES